MLKTAVVIMLFSGTSLFAAWSQPVLIDTIMPDSRLTPYITARNDTLLVLYTPNEFMRSLDGGQTWQDNFAFERGQLSWNNQNRLRGDTLTVLIMKHIYLMSDSVFIYFSVNFGESWQGPRFCGITATIGYNSCGYGGQEVSICQTADQADTLIHVVLTTSTDLGQNWALPDTIWTFHEWATPFLCYSYGRPFILLQGDMIYPNSRIKLLLTEWSGGAWELRDSLGQAGDTPSLNFDADQNGKVAFAYQDLVSVWNYSDIFVRVSADSGLSWSQDIMVSEFDLSERPRIAVQNDTILVSYNKTSPSDHRVILKRSHDLGQNWLSYETVAEPAINGDIDYEHGVVHAVYWGEHDNISGYFYRRWEPDEQSVEKDSLPVIVTLFNNYPNPFNARTRINFALKTDADISLAVYDILGHEITALSYGHRKAGYYSFEWDARELSSGVYFARIEGDGLKRDIKMTLVK